MPKMRFIFLVVEVIASDSTTLWDS